MTEFSPPTDTFSLENLTESDLLLHHYLILHSPTYAKEGKLHPSIGSLPSKASSEKEIQEWLTKESVENPVGPGDIDKYLTSAYGLTTREQKKFDKLLTPELRSLLSEYKSQHPITAEDISPSLLKLSEKLSKDSLAHPTLFTSSTAGLSKDDIRKIRGLVGPKEFDWAAELDSNKPLSKGVRVPVLEVRKLKPLKLIKGLIESDEIPGEGNGESQLSSSLPPKKKQLFLFSPTESSSGMDIDIDINNDKEKDSAVASSSKPQSEPKPKSKKRKSPPQLPTTTTVPNPILTQEIDELASSPVEPSTPTRVQPSASKKAKRSLKKGPVVEEAPTPTAVEEGEDAVVEPIDIAESGKKEKESKGKGKEKEKVVEPEPEVPKEKEKVGRATRSKKTFKPSIPIIPMPAPSLSVNNDHNMDENDTDINDNNNDVVDDDDPVPAAGDSQKSCLIA